MMQLQLFNWREEILNQKANALLDALNDGLKPKEMYFLHSSIQIKGLMVIMVTNKENDILGNILDFDGNIPKGFNVCWRIWSCILSDLKRNNSLNLISKSTHYEI